MKLDFQRLIRLSKVTQSTGASILGGFNHGEYPRHHFIYNLSAQPALPLHVDFAGLDEWQAGAFRYRRHSDIFSLELVQEGEFQYEQNGRTYRCPAGTLFFTHFGQDSAMACTTEFAVKQTVSLGGPLIEPLLLAFHLHEVDILALPVPSAASALLTEIANVLQQRSPDTELASSALAYRLLALLSMGHATLPLPEKLAAILQFATTTPGYTTSQPALAERFHLSLSSLNRLFGKYLHASPKEWLISQRMNAAATLLTLSERSIKEIALALGFSDPLYFSAAFRKRFGVSPLHYRQQPPSHGSPCP